MKMLQSITPSLYAYVGDIGKTDKVFATDLDWTLVRPIRGRFPKDANDWAFLPNRILTLKTYKDAGYTIVIFTNQGYKKTKLVTALNRTNNIITALLKENINPWVFAATDQDIYRKPSSGMWNIFVANMKSIDKHDSLFVGDAAGRPQDFSDADILFAKNAGLSFYVPEDIYPNDIIEIPSTQSMFIFVGMPGSGKSTYFEKNLLPLGWVHANQDKLKTHAKVLSTVKQALASGKSVAVDATNPGFEKRQEYIALARQYQIPILIIYFVGNGYAYNKLRDKPVPDIAYNIYFKNLVEPNETSDGVDVVEIV